MVEHLEKMDLLKRVDAKRTIEEVYVVSGKVVGATSFIPEVLSSNASRLFSLFKILAQGLYF